MTQQNLQVINAILFVAETGCKWRALPKRFGNWHSIYTRMNRWSKAGVLDRLFAQLQREPLIRFKIAAVSLDSTIVKVHMVAASARCAIDFSLSPGNAGDAPEGRALLRSIDELPMSCDLLMDCAHEGDETRQLALDLGFIPVVPLHPNRIEPWVLKKRRIFSRFDKLDLMFIAFIYFALIAEALR